MSVFQTSALIFRRATDPDRQSAARQDVFARAYATFETEQYVWVAALLDRSLLRRCVLIDGVSDAQTIADRWMAEACPCSNRPDLREEARVAAAYFLRLYGSTV